MSVSLFEVQGQPGKYGYEIQFGRSKIRQEHAPCINGLYYMSQVEAQQLANFIESKMDANLPWGVTLEQVENLWDGVKTSQQLIDEELAQNGV